MGFPRVLSKNNKMYTKLGDFCLAGDHFWIICHSCQAESSTQEQFWKHIQEEHNFVHATKENNRTIGSGLADMTTPAPLPLYRKVHEDEHGDDSQEQLEPKDYTEMRPIEPNAVEIDIKVEPPSIGQTLSMAPPPVTLPPSVSASGQVQMPVSAMAANVYQLSQASSGGGYSGIVHTSTQLSHLGMAAVAAAAGLVKHDVPKDATNNTAVSSEDGERWYICDFETCGLKFKYQSRLELHRSVHSKVRRFACELCGASFKQSCNLSTHRKKKHFLKGSKSLVQTQQTQQQLQQMQQHQQQQQQQRF